MSKDQFTINGEIEHLIHKIDIEEFDRWKFYGQTLQEAENELRQYLEALEEGLDKSFFNHEEYYQRYKDAQADLKASLNRMEDCMIEYQPVLFTDQIDQILKSNHLADTRQNRWCIAILLRKEEFINVDIMTNVLFKSGVMQGDGTENVLFDNNKNAEVSVQRVGDFNGK